MRLFLSLIITLNLTALFSQNVVVYVSNIRNTNGNLCIAVFTNEESFKNEAPEISKVVNKVGVKNGSITNEISLKSGIYGISVLDDENSDGIMSYNFMGIPTEGFGFSGFYLKGLEKPKFNQFKFRINDIKNDTVFVKMRYIM